MPKRTITLHLAAAVRDAAGHAARPGAVAVRAGRILAAGPVEAVRRQVADGACVERDHGAVLVLPAFVNAHAHLDLSGVGPRPYPGTFVDWVGTVLRERPTEDAVLRHAVETGLAASHAAGTGWLGDVAATPAAVRARLTAPLRLPGVSWLECLGIGAAAVGAAARATEALRSLAAEAARSGSAVRVGLQPHAPYSAGRTLYEAAAATGVPSTHLAETPEECEFVAHASGPFAELLQRLGKWDASIAPLATTPVRALGAVLERAPWVLAHCNYLDDDDVALLARTRVSVAYCPVASEYFGHRGHRYRDLLAAGVNVCLGTDSILCQPLTEPEPHGILPQVRRLHVRDGTRADLLLEMATVRGARALGLEPHAATLRSGAPARLAAAAFDANDPTDPLLQVLENDATLRPLDAES